jgi:transcriptional regulator with XRE-family HTH domain
MNSIRAFEQNNQYENNFGNINVLQHFQGFDMGEKRQADKEPEDMIMGLVINRLRIARGLTFEEMEEQLGFSRGYIHNATTGSGQSKLGRIAAFADFFGVTSDYLLRGEDQDKARLEEMIKAQNEKIRLLEIENAKQSADISFMQWIIDEGKKTGASVSQTK